MSALMVVDDRGKPVALGAEIARGGEGIVYELAHNDYVVAKLYLEQPDKDHCEKLQIMPTIINARLSALAAWPMATLHSQCGSIIGFTMQKFLGCRPVFDVYGPKLRLRHYPSADWRFLVRVAANAARAFSVIHECGHIIGDVNHGNMFVAGDATVRLIDADSFQVCSGDRTLWCKVGVGTHQPPEMQNLSTYSGVVRTSNHDSFGLAVFVFQLLCMGRHPFSGRYNGPGEPPDIAAAIARSLYAHSRDPRQSQMSPGFGSLPISVLPAEMQAMFEAAFAPEAAIGIRPSPAQWSKALQRIEKDLIRCRTHPGHWYPRSTGKCPWCDLESSTGAVLFPIIFVEGKENSGFALLWQEALSILEPQPLPTLLEPDGKSVSASPKVTFEKHARLRRKTATAVISSGISLAIMTLTPATAHTLPLLAMAAATGWFWNMPRPVAARDAVYQLEDARAQWKELETQWRAYNGVDLFRKTRLSLNSLKRMHDDLPEERKRRLANLMVNRKAVQLQHHLESMDISAMRIFGVSASKISTLISYGICSAADIKPAKIAPIPGFGPKTIERLIAAREAHEKRFSFNPDQAVTPAEIAALDQDIGRRRCALQRDLERAVQRLKAATEEASRKRHDLITSSLEYSRELAQAIANSEAV